MYVIYIHAAPYEASGLKSNSDTYSSFLFLLVHYIDK